MPTSQEFLDIVLSRTQRKLPTQIRAGFKITRIRGIYISSFEIRRVGCDERWENE